MSAYHLPSEWRGALSPDRRAVEAVASVVEAGVTDLRSRRPDLMLLLAERLLLIVAELRQGKVAK